MRVLIAWYKKAIEWSTHPKASWYLGLVAFLDASLFPISPMLMLLPMSFAAPKRSFYLGTVAAIASFLGGILGYALGYYCFESFMGDFIHWMGYAEGYKSAMAWFDVWGFWAVLGSCFLPLPYKVFTITAGIMQWHFALFLAASMASRVLRFALVAGLIYWGGPRVEGWFRKRIVL